MEPHPPAVSANSNGHAAARARSKAAKAAVKPAVPYGRHTQSWRGIAQGEAQLAKDLVEHTAREVDLTSWGPQAEALEAMVEAYICHAPMALALREINRLLAIDALPPLRGGKVLDVGCGDGFWWTIRDRKDCTIYGVDISEREVGLAKGRIHAKVCDVAKTQPFATERFDDIIGNCSLEHVRDLERALKNLRRCAAPKGRLVLFVPSQMWAYQGHMQRMLLRRAPRIGMALGGLMNGFFQHWHVYDDAHWRRLLEATGWRVTQAHGLGNARSEFLFRLLLPPAFGSFLLKKVTGEYPSRALGLLPEALLRYPKRLLTWALQDPLVAVDAPTAYEYMLVAEAAE